jgi:hypothetical protein
VSTALVGSTIAQPVWHGMAQWRRRHSVAWHGTAAHELDSFRASQVTVPGFCLPVNALAPGTPVA